MAQRFIAKASAAVTFTFFFPILNKIPTEDFRCNCSHASHEHTLHTWTHTRKWAKQAVTTTNTNSEPQHKTVSVSVWFWTRRTELLLSWTLTDLTRNEKPERLFEIAVWHAENYKQIRIWSTRWRCIACSAAAAVVFMLLMKQLLDHNSGNTEWEKGEH